MRHGYKGAFEIAATVDYLFAFAATSGCVADHHFDAVYEAYVENEEVQNFLKKKILMLLMILLNGCLRLNNVSSGNLIEILLGIS